MGSIVATSRCLLFGLTAVSLLSGCRSTPATVVSLPSESSLLAVDVRYPSPRGRDHSLVQAFFVRGPIHAGLEELPELIPASFVKRSRAYLLDPEPGTYSLVAVTSEVAPDWNNRPGVGGVTRTVLNEQLGHVVILPEELIGRTKTTTHPGDVAFMGALRVRRSDRINASSVLQDDLQQQIAERIRPGATSKSGFSGRFAMTWMVDLEETSLSNRAADRESFFDGALTDLGGSPWKQVIARAAPPKVTAARAPKPKPREVTAAGSRTPEPRETTAASARTPEPREVKAASARTPEPSEATATSVRTPAPSDATAASARAPEPHDATTMESPPQAPREAKADPAMTPEPHLNDPAPDPATLASKPQPPIPDSAPATLEPSEPPPAPERLVIAGISPDSPLAQIELGMHHSEVRKLLGDPDERIDRQTAKAWIPFYSGPGARLIDWVYAGVGRVVFSQHTGLLLVFDAVSEGDEPK